MTKPLLMAGKRGLIMGVANNHSIGWGIASTLSAHGADLAFTYQGEALKKRVEPLAASLGSSIVIPCDVNEEQGVEETFKALKKHWDSIRLCRSRHCLFR